MNALNFTLPQKNITLLMGMHLNNIGLIFKIKMNIMSNSSHLLTKLKTPNKINDNKTQLNRILSFELIIFLLLLTVIAISILVPEGDPDIWFHLKTGEYILRNHEIPKTDIFSFTTGNNPWLIYSWLFDVFIFFIFKYLSWTGMWAVKLIILQLTFWFIFITLKKKSENKLLAMLVTVFSIFSAMLAFTPRPWLFSFLFAAITLFILEEYRNRQTCKIWWLPLLALLWVNIHISFPVISILILFAAIEKIAQYYLHGQLDAKNQLYPLIYCGLLTLVCMFINPYIWRIFPLFLNLLREQWVYRYVSEMESPDFHLLTFIPFGIFLIAAISSIIYSDKKIKLYELLCFSFFAFLSLDRVRNIPFFVIVMSPLVMDGLSSLISNLASISGRKKTEIDAKKFEFRSAPINLAISVLLIISFALIVTLFNGRFSHPDLDKYPAKAAQYLKNEKLAGKIFNDFNHGGYLIYELYPRYQVFIDGRTTVHGEEVLNDYRSISILESGWLELLGKYKINAVLISNDSILGQTLRITPGWQLIYADSSSVIYIRS